MSDFGIQEKTHILCFRQNCIHIHAMAVSVYTSISLSEKNEIKTAIKQEVFATVLTWHFDWVQEKIYYGWKAKWRNTSWWHSRNLKTFIWIKLDFIKQISPEHHESLK